MLITESADREKIDFQIPPWWKAWGWMRQLTNSCNWQMIANEPRYRTFLSFGGHLDVLEDILGSPLSSCISTVQEATQWRNSAFRWWSHKNTYAYRVKPKLRNRECEWASATWNLQIYVFPFTFLLRRVVHEGTSIYGFLHHHLVFVFFFVKSMFNSSNLNTTKV